MKKQLIIFTIIILLIIEVLCGCNEQSEKQKTDSTGEKTVFDPDFDDEEYYNSWNSYFWTSRIL